MQSVRTAKITDSSVVILLFIYLLVRHPRDVARTCSCFFRINNSAKFYTIVKRPDITFVIKYINKYKFLDLMWKLPHARISSWDRTFENFPWALRVDRGMRKHVQGDRNWRRRSALVKTSLLNMMIYTIFTRLLILSV